MSSADELAQRYGRKSRLSTNQKYALEGVAIIVGVLIAFVVWRSSEAKVTGVVDTFQVTSATTVVVDFEVHKPSSTVASCTVRARNAAGAEVGRAIVTIPAGSGVSHLAYTLRTSDRAVTGEVQDCGPADQ